MENCMEARVSVYLILLTPYIWTRYSIFFFFRPFVFTVVKGS